MNKSILALILMFVILPGNPAFCQTPEETRMIEQEAARKMSEEYARTRDMDAQDDIINPDEYIIGPGDELTVFFHGAYTREEKLRITPEGSILISEFGEINLGRISLSQAKTKMREALAKRYHNIDISITLSQLRRLKVSVGGEVNFPGIYTISSLDRVTEAIKLAGGLNADASQRNIKIFRENSYVNADLLLYSRGGEKTCNPYLREGDKVFVPPMQRRIGLLEIYGSVKLPGIYEFVDGDRISELILLAGGMTVDADLNSAELVRFDRDRDSSLTIRIDLHEILENRESEKNLKLCTDDRLFIRAFPDYHAKARVTIDGEVVYPGTYAVKEDTTTLTELIEQAGGFTRFASLDEARMYRYGYEAIQDIELDRRIKLSVDQLSDFEREYLLLKSEPDQGRMSIDFSELFLGGNKELDVKLKDLDRIVIPKISNTVRIMGRVMKPGLLGFRPGADVDYYVARAGGFTRSADRGKIRIIKGVSGSIVKPSSKNVVEVGDQILVPEKKDINWWQITKDVGTFLANLATVYIVLDQVIN
jgi:protein involved in polysaccharide export with SLBB domain